MYRVFEVKKVLVFSMALMLLVLAACNDDTASSNKENDSGEASSSYPKDTIELVVPASAGGDTDRNARLLAKYLEDELDVSIVVQNVVGSSGGVGIQEVLDSDPDGYKVLYFHNNIILNNLFGVSENSYKDFKVVGVSELDNSNGLVVNDDAPYDSLKDLIKAAKENPGEIDMATSPGNFTHIQMSAFEKEADIEFNMVDAGDFAERNTALLGGHVDVLPIQLGLVDEYVENGDMKTLGVLSEERLEKYPDVPTFKEQGVDSVFEKFFFTALPKDTPDDIADTLADAIENVTKNEEYLEKAQEYGLEPEFFNRKDTDELMQNNIEKYEEILEEE